MFIHFMFFSKNKIITHQYTLQLPFEVVSNNAVLSSVASIQAHSVQWLELHCKKGID